MAQELFLCTAVERYDYKKKDGTPVKGANVAGIVIAAREASDRFQGFRSVELRVPEHLWPAVTTEGLYAIERSFRPRQDGAYFPVLEAIRWVGTFDFAAVQVAAK